MRRVWYGRNEVLDDISYMGEDVRYKITVENPSAFEYTKLDYILDNFNADGRKSHYLKPENIQLLFNDEENGKYLNLTISNAVLAKVLDQSTDVKTIIDSDIQISAQNSVNTAGQKYSGLEDDDLGVAYRDVTITLTKKGDLIQLTENSTQNRTVMIGDEGDYSDIASAFNAIGYILTDTDSYMLTWNYPAGYTFKGGTKMEFYINATIKNSLMYLPEEDYTYWYGYSDIVRYNVWNSATMRDTLGEESVVDTKQQEVTHDLEIRKGVAVNGVEIEDDLSVQENDILNYQVKIIHHGTGSYDVLPVVDHMTGMQAVIVEVKKNKDADWTTGLKTITIDETEYYVLNQEGTYYGVYTNEFYAYSIEVKKQENDDGLDTLIKYYIKDTPGREFQSAVTYKAIFSLELAGNGETTSSYYSIANEAWLNDRLGHRIWDTIFGSSSAVAFDKKILITGDEENPEDEELETSLPIKQDKHTVTYRLMLHSTTSVKRDDTGNITQIGPSITLTHNDIFDMLPLTGSAFDWGEANISAIRYRIGEAGYGQNDEGVYEQNSYGRFEYNGAELEGVSTLDEWYVTNDSPSTLITSENSDQQYLVWKEGFTVTLPPLSTVYMYMTLEFPGMDSTDTAIPL